MTDGRLGAAAAGVLLPGLGLAWVAGGVLMRGRSEPVIAAEPPASNIALQSGDGVTIAATYCPGSRVDGPAVLLLHGVGSSRGTMASTATWLGRQGYATLAIDFRGHGGSTPTLRTFGWREAEDARAGFDWLKRQQHNGRIAVIGVSMGGAASLLGQRGPLPADAMVLQAVYPDLRHVIRNRLATRIGAALAAICEPLLSYQAWPRIGVRPEVIAPVRAIGRFAGPVMVIGGTGDRSTPPEETRALAAAARHPAALWIAPTRDHADTAALASEEYHYRLLVFLRRHIGR